MLTNTIQFLYRFLSRKTLVRLCYMYDEPCFRMFLKDKVGYTTFSIQSLVKNRVHKLIMIKNTLKILLENNKLIIEHNGNMVVFSCLLIKEKVELVAIRAQILNRSEFRMMMRIFKHVVDDFHLDKCKITHAKDIVVLLRLDNNQFIEIPPYISLKVFDDTKVKPIYLDDLVT